MIFREAQRDGYVVENSAAFVDSVKAERKKQVRRPFSLAEIRSVLEVADGEWKSMILFGFFTGQRLGDVAARNANLIPYLSTP